MAEKGRGKKSSSELSESLTGEEKKGQWKKINIAFPNNFPLT